MPSSRLQHNLEQVMNTVAQKPSSLEQVRSMKRALTGVVDEVKHMQKSPNEPKTYQNR